MAFFRYFSIFYLIFFLLAGCANIQEGEIDYVKTLPNKHVKLKKNCSSEPIFASTSRPCYEPLFRKYEDAAPLSVGDTISIHLSAAFIEDTPESRTVGEYLTGQSANAELAIVVYACEQGVDGCVSNFSPKDEMEGRVVFFTNAAKAKQYLNFSYLPVYGPITYKGKPLIIQISIIELDINGDQEQNLVSTLADMGKKAYPPASSVFSALNTLGKTFLAGKQHDVMFRYSMVLAPDGGNKHFSHPPLSPGNLIFIRKDTVAGEQEAEPWRDILLDQKTGRLVTLCDSANAKSDKKNKKSADTKNSANKNSPCKKSQSAGGKTVQDYRGRTYLSMQIQNGFSIASLDSQQTLASLLQDLEQSNDKSYTQINEILGDARVELSQNSAQTDLGSPLEMLSLQLKQDDAQDRKDLQIIESNTYIDNLQTVLEKFVTNNCHELDKAKLSPCDSLPNKTQIEQLIIETRAILLKKDPSYALDTKLPLGISNAVTALKTHAADVKKTLSKIK